MEEVVVKRQHQKTLQALYLLLKVIYRLLANNQLLFVCASECTNFWISNLKWYIIKAVDVFFCLLEVIRNISLLYSILKIEQRFELKMRCYTTFYRWQQQSFQKNPLVVRRNFKYVKVSGILLAIYILGFCYTGRAEPISTIDASSSIPGKRYSFHSLFIHLCSIQ